MQSLNDVTLVGRLTKDPEIRYTQTGKQFTRFTIAVDRSPIQENGEWKKQEPDFIPIVVWGRQAENCATYLKKGRLVLVKGENRIRAYVDTKTGQKRTIFEVVAGRVIFLPANGHRAQAEEAPSEDEFPVDEAFGDPFGDDEPPF